MVRKVVKKTVKKVIKGPVKQAAKLALRPFGHRLPYRAARVIYTEGVAGFANKAKIYLRKKVIKEKINYAAPVFNFEPPCFNLPRVLPKVSIISILYNKRNEVKWFLDGVLEQSYQGPVEVIFVDDKSTDGAAELVLGYWDRKVKTNPKLRGRLTLKIRYNETNLGNCRSRNLGILEAEGEILVIIDADCVMNKYYLSSVVEAYFEGSCDVTVGPMNIETEGKNPLKLRDRLELKQDLVLKKMRLQDEINLSSYLNCVTRNFSIRSNFIEEPLFDEELSYSQDPESGFGWEDMEMGFRLYKKGAKIKFLNKTFTLHVTHPPSLKDDIKAQKSLRNFRKLCVKHPDVLEVSRTWTLETYRRIYEWTRKITHSEVMNRVSFDVEILKPRFEAKSRYKYQPFGHRKQRILTFRWHVPHQYELYRSGHQFDLLTGIVDNFTKEWSYDQRPFPANARFLPFNKLDFRDYDLAIVHFDENVLDWQNTNGVLDQSWGKMFSFFLDEVSLPKVAICHGTPQFYGQYNDDSCPTEKKYSVIEESRLNLVDKLSDVLVICNSYQAEREWQFKKSRVIWQGFEPSEFPLTQYAGGILSLGRAMAERKHYRGFEIFQDVMNRISESDHPRKFTVNEPEVVAKNNKYAYVKYRNYIDAIRDYSIYFNPTIRSPMPRSRGEAMMCGLTTISFNTHDVELFIKNGVNGFYSNDTGELAEYLNFNLKNKSACERIGKKGRATAMDLFNIDRYLSQWQHVISSSV